MHSGSVYEPSSSFGISDAPRSSSRPAALHCPVRWAIQQPFAKIGYNRQRGSGVHSRTRIAFLQSAFWSQIQPNQLVGALNTRPGVSSSTRPWCAAIQCVALFSSPLRCSSASRTHMSLPSLSSSFGSGSSSRCSVRRRLLSILISPSRSSTTPPGMQSKALAGT